MLESYFNFDPIESDVLYNLRLCRDAKWRETGMRVMIIAQTIDRRDLSPVATAYKPGSKGRKGGVETWDKTPGMLTTDETRTPVINAIKYAKKCAMPYLAEDKDLPKMAWCVVNFNNEKHLHLPNAMKREKEHEFAIRLHDLIEEANPTHILVSGDEAMAALYPKIKHPQFKRGHVHQIEGRTVVSTLDFYRMLEKDGEFANLLGFWCRHLANLMLGFMPHDLSKIEIKPVYVDTREKFDEVMEKFDNAKLAACDTETKNLSVLGNAIYTIQFAFDENPDIGYVIPVDHPLQECWSDEERAYVKKELKKRFGAKKGPTLVTFNGMFDLRIIRQALKLPIIWLKVWEITFSEHLLDENVNALNSITSMRDGENKSGFGGLRPILISYGNDFYFRPSKFGKSERASVGTVDPREEEFLSYCAHDVGTLLYLREAQIERAKTIYLERQNYQPYFVRHMMYQMSDTAHQLSHLRQDGSKISKPYLEHLLKDDGPLVKELVRSEGQFRVFPEVKKANKQLLREAGIRSGGLFNKGKDPWIFGLGKGDHKAKLFFDILGLEPLTFTEKGAPQINKAFVAHYQDKNKIIQTYGDYQKLYKLWSTYAKGWYKKFQLDPDVARDHHLRPDYTVWGVVTGRLASFGPNLQQIPSRGKLAKIIKRMFVAEKGYMLLRYDYSAHEVRIWSIASGDMTLAESFRVGQKLRQEFIAAKNDEERATIKKELKQKGDLHIQNVFRFFGKWVDKDDPLRDAIKAIIFGVLYGKSADTLGVDTKQSDLGKFKGDIAKLYDESLKAETTPERMVEINRMMEELDHKLTALVAEDRTAYAQGIIDKMFQEFPKGAAWTNKMQELAEKEYYVYSPIGRRRFLPAAITGARQIVAQQVRRGSNAPIQGFASEIGIKASRLIMEAYYEHLEQFMEFWNSDATDWEMRTKYNRVVHDANYFAVPYEMLIPMFHIAQYMATYGVTKAYKDQFNFEFTVEPEVEFELGAQDANSHKIDWSLDGFITALKATLVESAELDLLDGSKEDILDVVTYPWKNKRFRNYLQEHFPLLGVSDLDEQIVSALKGAVFEAQPISS